MLPYWSAHHWVRYGRVRLLQRVGGGSLSYHKISHYSAQAADGNIYLALVWSLGQVSLHALFTHGCIGQWSLHCQVYYTAVHIKVFYYPREGWQDILLR